MKYREDYCCNSSSSSFIARLDGNYINRQGKDKEQFSEFVSHLFPLDDESHVYVATSFEDFKTKLLKHYYDATSEEDLDEFYKDGYNEKIKKVKKANIDWNKDSLIFGEISYGICDQPSSWDMIYEE